MPRILNLHEVHDQRWLDQLVRYLKANYHLVSMDEIHGFYMGQKLPRKACHLTVDDGHLSFFRTIYPVLKKYQVPVSLFVSPKVVEDRGNYWFQEMRGYDTRALKQAISESLGVSQHLIAPFNPEWIMKTLKIKDIHAVIAKYQQNTKTPEKGPQNIDIEQLRALDQSGLVTIGAHTMTHPILQNEEDDHSAYEIRESIRSLSRLLEHPVRYFAYPNGKANLDFGKREENTLKEENIQLAVTTNPGNLRRNDNPMRIPRLGLTDGQRLAMIQTKLALGAHWQSIRNLKKPEELKQRANLRSKG